MSYWEDIQKTFSNTITEATRIALQPFIKELNAARAVVEAVRKWRLAKATADANTHLMLSSARTSDEAASIMNELYKTEVDILCALGEYDVATEEGR
jgi:hypothetical protein